MDMLQVIGIIVMVLAAIVLLCAGVIRLERRYPGNAYDERQIQAHGKASRLSLNVGMLYFTVVTAILVRQVDEPKWIEPYLLVFIGILLVVTVDHTYCLLAQAAMPLSEKPVVSIVSYALGGVIQLLYIWTSLDRFPLSLVGYGTSGWIHLLSGGVFLYLSLMHLLQYLRDRKASHE